MTTMPDDTVYYPVDWDELDWSVGLIDAVVSEIVGNVASPRGADFLRCFAQLDRFRCPSTSFTPLCLRMMYGIAYTLRAERLVGLGTGYGLVMGALAMGAQASGAVSTAIGVDLDPEATNLASSNAALLSPNPGLRFVADDAADWLGSGGSPIDLLLLDVDCPIFGKRAYAGLLERSLPRLAPGAVVLAHDAHVPQFEPDLDRLRGVIRREPKLEGPWDLPIGSGWTVAHVASR